MIRRSLRHVVTALVLLVAFVCQGTWALAGTTGGLSGTVVDATTSAPVAGATVTVSSPSQNATATTDAGGHFTFLTLAPDTYTVSVSKSGYQATSVPGQIVFADSVQTVSVQLPKALQTIAHTVSTSAGSLVKSGTTSDVYSVNAAMQNASAAVGGGGSLNSAYSAIATVPGAYVPPNQTGYYQSVHIRGGDYDQVGYEFDGVPVNRSFDNYPSSSASSLGNAEVQVYTGANPANSEGQGLSGYINQVIKTGTYPGYAEADLGIGTPTFYHKAAVEVGGATPDRLFSWYAGVGGYNQDFNYVNNNNGSEYDQSSGVWLAPCTGGPASYYPSSSNCNGSGLPGSDFAGNGYNTGPTNYAALSNIAVRDTVLNFHVGIPHHNDGGRDDVQVLWDSEMIHNNYYSTTNDIASAGCSGAAASSGAACAQQLGIEGFGPGFGQPMYFDGFNWTCQNQVGKTFDQATLNGIGPGCTQNYYYPNSTNRNATLLQCLGAGSPSGCVIPPTASDTTWNNQEIVKVQYTKNFGSSAFLRLYGYTYYSDWLQNGPQTTYSDWFGCCSPDYELSSHTRGLSAQFQDQINAQNLVSLQGGYVTSNTVRDNNTQMINFTGTRSRAAVVVNAGDPYGGYCFNAAGTATTCNPGAGAGSRAQFASWAALQAGAAAPLPATCKIPGRSNTQCTYLLAENSLWATYNNVRPQFVSGSLTDEFRPSDKWLFNLGVRLDSFTFNGGNAAINDNGGVARQFWYNAYNLDTCVVTATGAQLNRAPGAACPAGSHPAALQNVATQNFTFNIWQPRIAGTYTVNPNSVVRFSFGRYTEAPNSAFEIYNTLENDMPFALLGPNLYPYGRNTPGLPVNPPTSLNYDISFEQHLKGTDWSYKVTPFLRQTQEQVQNFFLNQQTGFVSGLNVGSQRSQGVEFQLQKGDFSRNGLAGVLSFAYTNSYIKYGTLTNGTTIISPINAAIAQYNSYTKACAPGGKYAGKSQFGVPLCGGTSAGTSGASPCYVEVPSSSGFTVAPSPCGAAGAYANPYYNQPGQSLIDPGQNFPTYSIFPAGIGSSASAYGAPYVATLLLNYKHDKWAVTPSFQFQGGGRYGAPETTPGMDPTAGCLPLPGSHRYDASTCAGTIVIPDQYTGTFDNLGSFTQPNSVSMNLQLSYDVSPRISLTGVLANIFNTCWGGTSAAWTKPWQNDGNICSYGIVAGGGLNPTGNLYNPPGSATWSHTQSFLQYPYGIGFGPYNDDGNSTKTPFNFYVTAKIRI